MKSICPPRHPIPACRHQNAIGTFEHGRSATDLPNRPAFNRRRLRLGRRDHRLARHRQVAGQNPACRLDDQAGRAQPELSPGGDGLGARPDMLGADAETLSLFGACRPASDIVLRPGLSILATDFILESGFPGNDWPAAAVNSTRPDVGKAIGVRSANPPQNKHSGEPAYDTPRAAPAAQQRGQSRVPIAPCKVGRINMRQLHLVMGPQRGAVASGCSICSGLWGYSS